MWKALNTRFHKGFICCGSDFGRVATTILADISAKVELSRLLRRVIAIFFYRARPTTTALITSVLRPLSARSCSGD
jgi:hypothetical protein